MGRARREGAAAIATAGVAGAAALGLILSAAGCAVRRPVLYPNERLASVGPAAAERDVDLCVERARAYTPGAGAADVAAGTATGAAVGAAVGAAAGAAGGRAYGGAGGGAAAGAAGGAVAALLRALFRSGELTPAQRGYVNQCLADLGYRVIGWQ